MSPLLQFIERCEVVYTQRAHFTLNDLDLIEQTVLYLNDAQPIDWMGEHFYDLPSAVERALRPNTPSKVLEALEPLFALLPDHPHQNKGLLQSRYYTRLIEMVMDISPATGVDLLLKGMKEGRHLCGEGESRTDLAQTRIVFSFAVKLIPHPPHLETFLQGFDQHHSPVSRERFYQKLLYEIVSEAQVDLFEMILPYMSLKSGAAIDSFSLSRTELFSMEWMKKCSQMNCELHTWVPPRELCENGSFDCRVWNLVDWINVHLTEENSEQVAAGMSFITKDFCQANETVIDGVDTLNSKPHPIFTQLWDNPFVVGKRGRIVGDLLQGIGERTLPLESGCATAWMLFSRLREEEKTIPDHLMSVLQQYPPYAKEQLKSALTSTDFQAPPSKRRM